MSFRYLSNPYKVLLQHKEKGVKFTLAEGKYKQLHIFIYPPIKSVNDTNRKFNYFGVEDIRSAYLKDTFFVKKVKIYLSLCPPNVESES